jgi:hypothetical protein
MSWWAAAAVSYNLTECPVSKAHIPAKIRNIVNKSREKCCGGMNSVYGTLIKINRKT